MIGCHSALKYISAWHKIVQSVRRVSTLNERNIPCVHRSVQSVCPCLQYGQTDRHVSSSLSNNRKLISAKMGNQHSDMGMYQVRYFGIFFWLVYMLDSRGFAGLELVFKVECGGIMRCPLLTFFSQTQGAYPGGMPNMAPNNNQVGP
jgi:hypothetical protein